MADKACSAEISEGPLGIKKHSGGPRNEKTPGASLHKEAGPGLLAGVPAVAGHKEQVAREGCFCDDLQE